MATQLKRATIAGILTLSLLLTLAIGSFLASGATFHSAAPLGAVCGGAVSTPC